MSERHFDRASERATLDRWITDEPKAQTTEHHPLCDDDGWDHFGPCVIETEIPDECPAGGPHTWTNDSSHPDRVYDRYYHCDECGASTPPEEKERT